MAETNERTTWYSVVVTALLGLATVVCVLWSGEKYAQRLHRRLHEEQVLIQVAEETIRTVPEVSDQLHRTEAFLAEWDRRKLGGDDLTQIMGELTTLAAATGVAPTRMAPQETVQHGWLLESRFRMAVKGTTEEVFRFISEAEKLDWEVWVNRVSLEPSEDPADPVSCEIDFVGYGEGSGFSG
ncbi:MAG: hypothetical protein D6741_01420 [Planctomycetota bacterium]|nr:MAG: hypothetical protein D6741_01420 [Planctomycetota bacterium]